MELWKCYKLLRFIKDNSNLELPPLLGKFHEETGLNANEIWEGCIEQHLAEYSDNKPSILFEGRELLNGKIGRISLGLILAELRIWWLLIILVFGSSSIYQFIYWLWHI